MYIANPVSGSGKGRKLAEEISSCLKINGIETVAEFTEGIGHATRIAGDFDPGEFDGICIQGGDGTVHEFANGMLNRTEPIDLPIGLIPGGTGNSIHHQLGLEDPEVAVEKIKHRQTVPVDLIKLEAGCNIFYCVNLVGWASVANIAERAERQRWLGGMRYSVAALIEIGLAKRLEGALVWKDKDGVESEVKDDFFLVIGCNTQRVGSGMKMAPRASLQDGLIDLVFIRNASRWQMLQLFQKVHSGAHIELPFVEYRQVREFRLESPRSLSVNLDGNVSNESYANFDVRVADGVLEVFA